MTPTKGADSSLIKTDCLGRVHLDKKHREQLLDIFENSPLSGAKFAEIHGVKYQTFASWVQKRKRERGQYANAPEQSCDKLLESLVELELAGPRNSESLNNEELRIDLPAGATLRISSAGQLDLAASLLRKLNEISPC